MTHIEATAVAPAVPAPRGVARNFAALAAPEVANRASRFLAALVLARGLSLHDYSVVNVAIAAAGVGVVLTTLGLPEIGSREVAIDHSRAGWVSGRVLVARGGVVLSGLVAGLAVAGVSAPGTLPLVALIGVMVLCVACSADWLLRGLERMGRVGAATAIGGGTVLVGSVAAVNVARGSTAAMGAFVAGEAVSAGLCWASVQVRPRLGITGIRGLIRRSRTVAVSTIAMQTYYANLDTIIIAATRPTREAGLYTAAYRLFLTLNFASVLAAYAMFPILVRARESGKHEGADRVLDYGTRALAAYGLLVLGAVEVAGTTILSLLFGARFATMNDVLVVLCIGLMWYTVGFPIGYAFVAEGRNRRYLFGAVVAASLNISLNLLLIPGLGPMGAAISTAVAFSAACIAWVASARAVSLTQRTIMMLFAAASAAAVAGVEAPDLQSLLGVATLLVGLVAGLSALPAVRPRMFGRPA